MASLPQISGDGALEISVNTESVDAQHEVESDDKNHVEGIEVGDVVNGKLDKGEENFNKETLRADGAVIEDHVDLAPGENVGKMIVPELVKDENLLFDTPLNQNLETVNGERVVPVITLGNDEPTDRDKFSMIIDECNTEVIVPDNTCEISEYGQHNVVIPLLNGELLAREGAIDNMTAQILPTNAQGIVPNISCEISEIGQHNVVSPLLNDEFLAGGAVVVVDNMTAQLLPIESNHDDEDFLDALNYETETSNDQGDNVDETSDDSRDSDEDQVSYDIEFYFFWIYIRDLFLNAINYEAETSDDEGDNVDEASDDSRDSDEDQVSYEIDSSSYFFWIYIRDLFLNALSYEAETSDAEGDNVDETSDDSRDSDEDQVFYDTVHEFNIESSNYFFWIYIRNLSHSLTVHLFNFINGVSLFACWAWIWVRCILGTEAAKNTFEVFLNLIKGAVKNMIWKLLGSWLGLSKSNPILEMIVEKSVNYLQDRIQKLYEFLVKDEKGDEADKAKDPGIN